MKALILIAPGQIEWRDLDKPVASAGKALVKMKGIALNRRDEWIKQGQYPNIRYGGTLGSDGAGVVESVGDQKDNEWIGKEVVINPNIDWGPDPDCPIKKVFNTWNAGEWYVLQSIAV